MPVCNSMILVVDGADFVVCSMPELEPPFRPREKLLQLQRYFQNVHKHTYLKGRYDAVTSVGIPLALAVSSLFLIVSSCYTSLLLLEYYP